MFAKSSSNPLKTFLPTSFISTVKVGLFKSSFVNIVLCCFHWAAVIGAPALNTESSAVPAKLAIFLYREFLNRSVGGIPKLSKNLVPSIAFALVVFQTIAGLSPKAS